MFYTEILECDSTNYKMNVTQHLRHLQLKEAIPSFFTRDQSPNFKVHVVVLCSDCKTAWNDQMLLGQFNDQRALTCNVPDGNRLNDDRVCVCSSQNSIGGAIDAIVEKVESFYGVYDRYFRGVSEGLKCRGLTDDEATLWSNPKAAEALSDAIPKKREFSLYLLIRLPSEYFERIKKYYLPTFIEFVVKESAIDPDMEMIKAELDSTRESYEGLKEQYEKLLSQVKAILNDIVQSIDKLNSQESYQESIVLLREKWKNLSELVEEKWKNLSELAYEQKNKEKILGMR